MNQPPQIWVLHDGKIGMANQVTGLAEALGWPISQKRLEIRAPWRFLAPSLWLAPSLAIDPAGARLEPPWPDIVIACGRNSIVPARLVKRASGGKTFWVQIQDPRSARGEIDLIVAPQHDLAVGENVFRTLGAVHRVTAEKLGADAARWAPTFASLPRPLVAVLIGGDNAVYRLTEAMFSVLCDRLVALAKSGVGLAITPSRRTGEAQRAMLTKRLAGLPAFIWDGNGDNPYFAMLGAADAIVVTADSVSMISEAASTGKPVHIVELEGGSAKFARFHQAMREAGITRLFNGTLDAWHYTPLDDTARAAAEIRRRLEESTLRMRGALWFSVSFLLLCGGLILLPGIDLWASSLFYRTGDGFFLGDWPPFEIVHDHLNVAVWVYAIAVIAAGTASLARRRAVLGLTPRAAIFLLLSLALGPGLTVNTIFKDHWGRARPTQIAQFGGTQKFTPAFVPSDQCRRNCSFPAGDPAMGFYLVSAAFLAGGATARRSAVIGAVALGAALGVVRLAQGGHFLSDVIASGFIVAAIAWGLHWLILRSDAIERWWRALCHPSPGLKRFAWLTLACVLGFFIAYRWIDIPLASALQNIDPVTRAIFGFITRLGEGGVYLVPLAVLLVWTWLKRERLWSLRAAFVFIAIAVPGIAADIMKPVFARARPVLLFRDHVFGFTWGSPHANTWSFPSGHSVTIATLAVALTAVYPPAWPAYALLAFFVMASRIILDQHYLSDVIAGFYIGFAFALAFVIAARRNGLPLEVRKIHSETVRR